MKPGFYLFAAVLLAACGEHPAPAGETPAAAERPLYRVVGQDLGRLREDFNANRGRVRLLFINGPTCGICLRGLADLNDAFLAARQHDDRLVTFVVHVPTMGAEERHAAESIALLDGPRIHHYWEETGIIGQLYGEVMDTPYYVWDFWTVYGPEAAWEGRLPPAPDYYEHQLGVTSGGSKVFPPDRVLDAERFAAKTLAAVDALDLAAGQTAASVAAAAQSARYADGTEIPWVGQPRSIPVRQHIMGRGGYRNLKRIQGIHMRGHLVAGGREYGLKVSARRPARLRRELSLDKDQYVAEIHDHGVSIETGAKGPPTVIDQALLESFEFDGLLVDWPDKGHTVSMDGMRKIDDVLAWKLRLNQAGERSWNLYLDSHSGDLVQKDLLDAQGRVVLSIRQDDFREVTGFRFPHQVSYRDGAGRLIAAETIGEILLQVEPPAIDAAEVVH